MAFFRSTRSRDLIDPVAAYDRIAPVFPDIRRARHKYLRGIEDLVVQRIPSGSASLLDVGAGDGSRAERIARLAGLTEVVLLEPSAEMAKAVRSAAEIWTMRAEELDSRRSFDVIMSLWNVIGHLRAESRMAVLKHMGRMLSPEGRMFLDVQHRYNIAAYGLLKTAGRCFLDRGFPAATNGDVEVTWASMEDLRTYGHVFTDREMRRLIASADLTIEERIVVDYDSGAVRRFAHQGNLLYVLRRNSSKDFASASQTSSTSPSVI